MPSYEQLEIVLEAAAAGGSGASKFRLQTHTTVGVGWAWAWPSEKDSPPRKWVALEVDTNPVNDPGCSSENKKSYLMVEIIVIMIMI